MLKEIKSIIDSVETLQPHCKKIAEAVAKASQKKLKDMDKAQISGVVKEIEETLKKVRKTILR